MDKRNQENGSNPREIPTRKTPNQVDPVKDPDLQPSKENPRNPRPDDSEIPHNGSR